MLNFFVTLTNTVGIPTVLIGTSKAQKVFNGNFRQARRAGSDGSIILFLLAQERALQDGKEELTVSIIRETAKKDLHMIQPMIKALRNNNLAEIMKYEDISINYDEVTNAYVRNIELKRRSSIESLIVELSEMDIFDYLDISNIRKICEKVVKNASVNED